MKDDFTTGSVWKKLLLFVIPIFGANLLQAMYGTVDLMIVGLFSDAAAVSAVSTGSMTTQTITGIITGLTMGCTVLLGHYIGQKDEKGASKTIGSAALLYVALGVLVSVGVLAFAKTIATLMNAPEEAYSATVSYIKICGGGMIFVMLFNAISGVFRGLGNSRLPLILMAIACVTNILGDLLFVGGLKLGSDGAAVATVAAQAISVVSALVIISKKGFGFKTDKKYLKPTKNETVSILRYGLPIAIQEALTGLSFMVILAILNTFGLVASAGVGVAEKLCSLMFLVPGAFMSAVSAFSAQNVGAKEYGRAKKCMYYGMEISTVFGTAMFLVSFLWGDVLAGFFTTDPEVVAAAADYLRSYAVDCAIVGLNFSMMGYFNGNGKTTFVAAQGVLSAFLVRIPVSYFMSKIPGVSLFQIGFATPLATIAAIIMDIVYLIHFEKTKKIS
jgi:putative MATE family efflux protein